MALFQGYHFTREVFSILNNDDEGFCCNFEELTALKAKETRSDRVINIIGYEVYHLDYQESSNFILEAESNIDSC